METQQENAGFSPSCLFSLPEQKRRTLQDPLICTHGPSCRRGTQHLAACSNEPTRAWEGLCWALCPRSTPLPQEHHKLSTELKASPQPLQTRSESASAPHGHPWEGRPSPSRPAPHCTRGRTRQSTHNTIP